MFETIDVLIGNGNLGGVATAIAIGGPGAVFWFWVASLFAMVLVYAETYLAVSQRERGIDGTFSLLEILEGTSKFPVPVTP